MPGAAASLITTPFGRESTAAEVVAGIDLSGRRAIVTGGASGIGVETARALAGAGAEVTLAVRTPARRDGTAETRRHHRQLERRRSRRSTCRPASVDGVRRGWDGPLHILVNNAGVMASPS